MLTAKRTMITTSINTVTPSAVEVNGPRARISLITAIVEGGERASRTVLPSIATARRLAGAMPCVNGMNSVRM